MFRALVESVTKLVLPAMFRARLGLAREEQKPKLKQRSCLERKKLLEANHAHATPVVTKEAVARAQRAPTTVIKGKTSAQTRLLIKHCTVYSLLFLTFSYCLYTAPISHQGLNRTKVCLHWM